MGWSSVNAFWEWLASVWQSIVPPAVIVFPAEPTPNQDFGRFYWNNEKQTWDFN